LTNIFEILPITRYGQIFMLRAKN